MFQGHPYSNYEGEKKNTGFISAHHMSREPPHVNAEGKKKGKCAISVITLGKVTTCEQMHREARISVFRLYIE